jgi:hypothetical protein
MLAKQELCLLSHTSSPICHGSFGDGVSNLPGLALSIKPPSLRLSSSWSYRHEPPVPGLFIYLEPLVKIK